MGLLWLDRETSRPSLANFLQEKLMTSLTMGNELWASSGLDARIPGPVQAKIMFCMRKVNDLKLTGTTIFIHSVILH